MSPENFEKLKKEFEVFERLPATDEAWKTRKGIADGFDRRVRDKEVKLTKAQFRECQKGDHGVLGRIVSYLLIEHEQFEADLASRRANIRSEWDGLQTARFAPGNSTMPLHYA